MYFLHSHFPSVETEFGEDEVVATQIESGLAPSLKKKKGYDLKIKVSSKLDSTEDQHFLTLKYYYQAMKIKLSWLTSPKNDLMADSICLLILEIKDRATPQLLKMIEITK
jgi:hypothetical protein